MKVAYLVNCYPRVSHTFIRREIAALERQGVTVERYSVRRETGELVDEADRREQQATRVLLDAGLAGLVWGLCSTCLTRPSRMLSALRLALQVSKCSDAGLLKHFAYLAEACVLLGLLAKSGASHVHAHFGTNSTTVAMLCHALGGPTYSFTAHGPEEFDKPLMLGLSEKIERARFVIAISEFGRSQLYRRVSHAHWPKIHVVHCGLDDALLCAEASPVPDNRRVACVARLHEQKGQLVLLEAVARLLREGVALELVLVGDGELRADLERAIAELGIAAQVSITGWVDAVRVREEIEAARLFVLPSFAEGLPVVLMEALALGRPVVTTQIAGIPELVSEASGLLVPAGSVDALVAALRAALALPRETLERMGKVGQARVRKDHDANVEAAKLRALFESA